MKRPPRKSTQNAFFVSPGQIDREFESLPILSEHMDKFLDENVTRELCKKMSQEDWDRMVEKRNPGCIVINGRLKKGAKGQAEQGKFSKSSTVKAKSLKRPPKPGKATGKRSFQK